MRSIITSFVLAFGALIASAQAGPQINPANQIQWPTCTSGQVYAPSTNTCVTAGGGTSAAQTNYGFSSAGLAQEVHVTDSTGPGGVLVLSGAPVNGTGTNECPGPGSPPANQGLTYYRYDTTPAQIFYCDLTDQVWKSGPAYSSTSVQLFQNYNQQSPYSVINGVFPYAGTLYSNDGTAGINTGNATTPDIGNIETYPNENPPDVASPDYYVQSGTADVFNCTGGLSWPTTYSNCDLSVRGAETALLMWLGSPQHGKYLARNQTKTGTWTDTDPTSQTTTGTWSSGATTITVASATGIAKGQRVTDTTNPNNLPSPAIVTDVTGTTVTLSIAAPAAGSSDSLKFWNTVNSPYRWGVATCGTTGATLTFNLMPATGTFYLAWLVNSGGTATANLVIDGGVATALSDNVLGSWSTPHTTTMWYGERFSLNSTLSHTVVLTVTAGSFCPLFAVTPNPQGWQGMTLPNVYAQIAPPPAGGYTSQGAVVQAAQSAVFAQMRADGFHVTPVDSFDLTWPEGKGSSLYCEYNYTCTYPSGLASNQAAGPHFNWLGDRFNADAFLQQAGRTQKLVGTDLDGNKNVTGIAGVPFCNGFTPTAGQNLQYTTSSVPVPCWGATNAAGGMTYAGTWSSANAYALGSVVSYNGNSYVSILAVPSPGSPTLIQAQSGYSSVVSPRPSILLNSNVTAGDVLYVGYSCSSAPGNTTLPTDSRGDNTWVLINSTTGTTNGDSAYLYATTIHSSGPMTVFAPAFGGTNMNMAVMEMSNVLTTYQASYHDDRQFFPNPVTWSPTFTPANPAVLVAYMMTTNNSNPVTIGAGMNMATKMQNGFSSGLGYAIVNAGTYNYGLTTSPTVSDNGFYVENSFNQANANPTPDTDSVHWVSLGGSGGGTITYTASHTAASIDSGKLMIFNCSSTCTLTLPNPQPSNIWSSKIISVGSSPVLVSLGSGMTFNGGLSAPAPNSYRIMSLYADSNISTDYKGEAPLSAGTGVTLTPASNQFAIAASGAGSGGNWTNIGSSVTFTGCTFSSGKCVVGSATPTITISGIPGTYLNLHLRISGQNSNSTAQAVTLQFNGDTAAHYRWESWYVYQGGGNAGGSGSDTSIQSALISGTGGSTWGGGVIDINDYANSTSPTHQVLAQSTFWNNPSSVLQSNTAGALWLPTSPAAITSISMSVAASSNFQAGTVLVISADN